MTKKPYIKIEPWMIEDEELRTPAELLIYAIIYSFTVSKAGWFTGGATYLAENCKLCEKTVKRTLSVLVEKNKINKDVVYTRGCISAHRYCANPKNHEGQNDLRHEGQNDLRHEGHFVQPRGTFCPTTRDKLSPSRGTNCPPYNTNNTNNNSIYKGTDFNYVHLLSEMSVNRNGLNDANKNAELTTLFTRAVERLSDENHRQPGAEIVYAWFNEQREKSETVTHDSFMPNLKTWLETRAVARVNASRKGAYWERKYLDQFERLAREYS